jgi:hypothetical protein
MIAVSNTSPLIALSKIGYVVYLRELFERVYIPKGVELETSKKDDDVWDATEKQINPLISGFQKIYFQEYVFSNRVGSFCLSFLWLKQLTLTNLEID